MLSTSLAADPDCTKNSEKMSSRVFERMNECRKGGGGSKFPYILLNEIQTMFSQLAKQPWRHQSADSCNAREHNLSSQV